MPLKDDPRCYHADYGIKEWQCDGDAVARYDREGNLRGYTSLCSTCWDIREQIFEYPCQDKYCLGDNTIRLKGSQVAGHYRNMSEKSDWIFPPLRCPACKKWLENVGQTKKPCEACGRTFVIPKGRLIQAKKFEGNPTTHGPKFCRSCEEKTDEERRNLIAKREARKKAVASCEKLMKLGLKRDDAFRFIDPKTGELDLKVAAVMSQLTSITRAIPMSPRSTIADMIFYQKEKTAEGNRVDHMFEKHGHQFNPPFTYSMDMIKNADRIQPAHDRASSIAHIVGKIKSGQWSP
ncbi:MAG: hypothetical protein NTW50_01050 [Candidatus Berkelbacteria bacterium]|nr:hypothetical protein [Candidatus Berkelbacteria bacterium]